MSNLGGIMRESGLLRYARNNDVHSIATLFWV